MLSSQASRAMQFSDSCHGPSSAGLSQSSTDWASAAASETVPEWIREDIAVARKDKNMSGSVTRQCPHHSDSLVQRGKQHEVAMDEYDNWSRHAQSLQKRRLSTTTPLQKRLTFIYRRIDAKERPIPTSHAKLRSLQMKKSSTDIVVNEDDTPIQTLEHVSTNDSCNLGRDDLAADFRADAISNSDVYKDTNTTVKSFGDAEHAESETSEDQHQEEKTESLLDHRPKSRNMVAFIDIVIYLSELKEIAVLQRLRNARSARILQRVWRHYWHRKQQCNLCAVLRSSIQFVIGLRIWRKISAIKVLDLFLRNTSQEDMATKVKKFITRVRKCQRICRDYVVVTRARVDLIHSVWLRIEAQFRKDIKEKELKQAIDRRRDLQYRLHVQQSNPENKRVTLDDKWSLNTCGADLLYVKMKNTRKSMEILQREISAYAAKGGGPVSKLPGTGGCKQSKEKKEDTHDFIDAAEREMSIRKHLRLKRSEHRRRVDVEREEERKRLAKESDGLELARLLLRELVLRNCHRDEQGNPTSPSLPRSPATSPRIARGSHLSPRPPRKAPKHFTFTSESASLQQVPADAAVAMAPTSHSRIHSPRMHSPSLSPRMDRLLSPAQSAVRQSRVIVRKALLDHISAGSQQRHRGRHGGRTKPPGSFSKAKKHIYPSMMLLQTHAPPDRVLCKPWRSVIKEGVLAHIKWINSVNKQKADEAAARQEMSRKSQLLVDNLAIFRKTDETIVETSSDAVSSANAVVPTAPSDSNGMPSANIPTAPNDPRPSYATDGARARKFRG